MKYKELERILETYKEYDLSQYALVRGLFHKKNDSDNEKLLWYDEEYFLGRRYSNKQIMSKCEQEKNSRINNLLHIINDLKEDSKCDKTNILNNIKILINDRFLNDEMFEQIYEIFKQLPENEAKVLYDLISTQRVNYTTPNIISGKYYEKIANCNNENRKDLLMRFFRLSAAGANSFEIEIFDALLNAKTDVRAMLIFRFCCGNRWHLTYPGALTPEGKLLRKIIKADTDEKAYYLSRIKLNRIGEKLVTDYVSELIFESKSGQEAEYIYKIYLSIDIDNDKKIKYLNDFAGHPNCYFTKNNTDEYLDYVNYVSDINSHMEPLGFDYHIDRFIIEDEVKKEFETIEEQQRRLQILRQKGHEYIDQTLCDAIKYVDGDKEKEIPNAFFLNRKVEN